MENCTHCKYLTSDLGTGKLMCWRKYLEDGKVEKNCFCRRLEGSHEIELTGAMSWASKGVVPPVNPDGFECPGFTDFNTER